MDLYQGISCSNHVLQFVSSFTRMANPFLHTSPSDKISGSRGSVEGSRDLNQYGEFTHPQFLATPRIEEVTLYGSYILFLYFLSNLCIHEYFPTNCITSLILQPHGVDQGGISSIRASTNQLHYNSQGMSNEFLDGHLHIFLPSSCNRRPISQHPSHGGNHLLTLNIVQG